MRKLTLLMMLAALGHMASAQKKIVKKLNSQVEKRAIEAHLRFLASDELRGRDTGSPELDIAAMYIAQQFRSYGLKPAPGSESYFQQVDLVKNLVPKTASIKMGDKEYADKKDFIFLDGVDTTLTADVMYLNYGLEEDFEGKDVTGKFLIVKPGTPDKQSPREYFSITREKRKRAQENGAAGMIELYKSAEFPWPFLVNYLSQPRFAIKDDTKPFPFAWLFDGAGETENMVVEYDSTLTVNIDGIVSEPVPSKNVFGWLEGTDEDKKDEFLILTAHYDHVGVTYQGEGVDSIFNGARDNAIGTTTLLETAKFFAKNRPAYSVAFLACTAEEKGLLGSEWYSENPIIPLEKTYFNFNTDGAGYNDTKVITVVGLERTGVTDNLHTAAETFGLKAKKDPVPEQNLYDRSDNVSFAAKGVPAISFSPGVKAFDDELMKYYHQPADEVESLDMDYLFSYAKSFIYAAYLIANMDEKPYWTPGDKYESEGNKLYGKE